MKDRKKIRFLIVSGPTREPIDPVRYLSNYSTGLMGKFLAETARKKGHRCVWVRCPEDAETARGLEVLLKKRVTDCDVLIMAAAVCDVRPATVSKIKTKKRALKTLRLVKNPDILASLARKKKPGQIFVGFALESQNLLRNAAEKMRRKHLEMILAQRVTPAERPFGDTEVRAVLLRKDGTRRPFGKAGKRKIAEKLIQEAENVFLAKNF